MPAATPPLALGAWANVPAVQGALAQEINTKLAGKPMAGTGAAFVSAANANGISPWFLVSIAGAETEYGRTAGRNVNNAFGMHVTGPGVTKTYPSWEAGINAAARNLSSSRYAGANPPRVTIDNIGDIWAADKQWAEKVARIMSENTGRLVAVNTVVLGPMRNLPGPGGPDIADDLGIDSFLGGILNALKFITNPAMWVRVAEAVAGFAGIVGGVFLTLKSDGAGKPVGIVILSLGLLFVTSALRNVNPVDEIKAMVGA